MEGGARLNYACLQERIVDELVVTITPTLSGQKGAAALVDGEDPLGNPFLKLKLLDQQVLETGELVCRYNVLNRR